MGCVENERPYKIQAYNIKIYLDVMWQFDFCNLGLLETNIELKCENKNDYDESCSHDNEYFGDDCKWISWNEERRKKNNKLIL